MQPTVSIIIPAYNVGDFLKDTVLSVQQQAFTDWEIVLVNDGSTDNTLEIATSLASHDPRIKVIDQHNQGVSVARNNGFFKSMGLFVVFLDGDDLWPHGALQALMSKQQESGADVVYGRQNTMRLNGHIDIVYDDYPSGNILLQALRHGMVHIGGTLINRRLLAQHEIVFTPGCTLDEDTEFIWKVLALAPVQWTDQVVLTRRDRVGSANTLAWSWRAASHSIASYERLAEFVKTHYNLPDQQSVLQELDFALNFRRFKAIWQLIKRKQFETIQSALDRPEWRSGITHLDKSRLSASQRLEYFICTSENAFLWSIAARFAS